MPHIPVLHEEVLRFLDPQPEENFIDCTIGGGGHARMVLERTAPNGRLLGIDWSAEAIQKLEKEFAAFGKRIALVQGNFKDIRAHAYAHAISEPRGILMDLGFSSDELENPRLGLSFQKEGLLDMRLGGEGVAAAEIVNTWSEADLVTLIRKYGEERYAASIARSIIQNRKGHPIVTTTALARVITDAVPRGYERGRMHPATRTFQALRIEVNDEIGNLEAALPEALSLLGAGGRLAVISFHSLEDRIVKRFFRDQGDKVRVLTKKPIQVGEEEVRRNPRARSAKLRAVIKL